MAGWQAGRLADKVQLDFWILKILYRLNYLDFYFVYSSSMLLIVLEVHFSLLFSNKVYFRCIKFGGHFFISIPLFGIAYLMMHYLEPHSNAYNIALNLKRLYFLIS